MRWPWINRSRVAGRILALRRAVAEQTALAAKSEGARAELRESLIRCELERSSSQAKLLRVSFGMSPFPEDAVAVQQQEEQAAPTVNPYQPQDGMSDQELSQLFAREGQAVYGNKAHKIVQHVQRRKDEWYQHRSRPAILTNAEIEQAQRIAADMEAAIAEGQAAFESVN